MSFLLKPLAFVFEKITELRNFLYSRGFIGCYYAPVPVVSIGNLTVGGTGKTPLTDFCLKKLVSEQIKVALLSRSYGGKVESPCLVDANNPSGAKYYGDEPFLLAQQNPDVDVFVGSSKWKTARYATSINSQIKLMIVDDGFQHQKLFRNLNILILDATEELKNYKMFPQGRARESWKNIDRADLIVLTKCNMASEDSLRELKKILPLNKEILSFGFEINGFARVLPDQNKNCASVSDFKGKKIFLVSAVARPDIFEKMMNQIGEVSSQSLKFRDHHQYDEKDLLKIKAEFEKSGCDLIVTTEKDAVKLKPLLLLQAKALQIWSAHLEVSELEKRGRLDELIHQCLR
jgi:tetraacyldisaccharide 4'-kinase